MPCTTVDATTSPSSAHYMLTLGATNLPTCVYSAIPFRKLFDDAGPNQDAKHYSKNKTQNIHSV